MVSLLGCCFPVSVSVLLRLETDLSYAKNCESASEVGGAGGRKGGDKQLGVAIYEQVEVEARLEGDSQIYLTTVTIGSR